MDAKYFMLIFLIFQIYIYIYIFLYTQNSKSVSLNLKDQGCEYFISRTIEHVTLKIFVGVYTII